MDRMPDDAAAPSSPPAQAPRVDRRTLMLDASIRVIAANGLRGLTHRAVQEEAGLPNGSVTYYFKTRDQLVLAVVDRMTDLDRVYAGQLTHELMRATAVRPIVIDYVHMAEFMSHWWTECREVQLARLELEIAGTREPVLHDAMIRCQAEFRSFAELIALSLGSSDPELDGQVMLSFLDGLLFDFVTRDAVDPRYLEVGLRRAIESVLY